MNNTKSATEKKPFKALIVVDMQNDFISGSLGSPQAKDIVENVCKKIENFDGDLILCTEDRHFENYLDTQEGKKLPIKHCLFGTEGSELDPSVRKALTKAESKGIRIFSYYKQSFGYTGFVMERSLRFEYDVHKNVDIEVVGLCTDICVISNVMILKAAYPEAKLRVDTSCCAGSTYENHLNAILAMRNCQVDIYNGEEDFND